LPACRARSRRRPRVEQGATIDRKGYKIQKLRTKHIQDVDPALLYQPTRCRHKVRAGLLPESNGHVGPLGRPGRRADPLRSISPGGACWR